MPAPQIAPPGHIEGREDPVGQPRHARQAGDQDAQRGGETPEEHRPATALGQVLLAALDAPGFQETPEGPGPQQAVPVLAAHQVADRVANQVSGDPRDQDRPQADPAVGGEHPAEDQRGLPGEDEAEEDRGLEGPRTPKTISSASHPLRLRMCSIRPVTITRVRGAARGQASP